jgi:hypothetical protein
VNRSAAPASSRRPLPKAEAVGQQLADRRATHATGARAADRSSRADTDARRQQSRAEPTRPSPACVARPALLGARPPSWGVGRPGSCTLAGAEEHSSCWCTCSLVLTPGLQSPCPAARQVRTCCICNLHCIGGTGFGDDDALALLSNLGKIKTSSWERSSQQVTLESS